jgi:RNA recognition motif-containing protein
MNLYVSNLSFHTTEDDLRKLFEDFGNVTSAKVITDRTTGKSRGFGFVEMSGDDDARNAMSGLNGKDIEGRTLSVSEARERAPRSENKRW